MFDLFRSFLPLLNPLGFGGADFIELGLALLLVLFAFARRSRMAGLVQKLAYKTGWCMLLVGALPIALRLALLPHNPIPSPGVADDFSYLLSADTLLHFRLANPPHPLHQFFETYFALQEPSYSSIFPLGQGMALAFGRLILGHPWAGVALSIGVFCALSYWMLRAWTTPLWALAGGLLAAIQFGPLNQWMNSYWGGAVSAAAGCLVFGSLPRIRETGRTRDLVLLGAGLGLQILTRPYESVLLALCVILFFLPALRKRTQWPTLARSAAVVALAVVPALGLTLLQNKAVTKNWTTLPYMLSRYQYGVPTTFTVQRNPAPHRILTPQQELDYAVQSAVHGRGTDTAAGYFERLAFRVRYYRFFFLAPLYLALPFFLISLRRPRYIWVALCLLIFALGTNFYPYFYSHYIAAVACLFLLISVVGLERLSQIQIRGFPAGRDAAGLIVFLCAAHFIFWYGLHLAGTEDIARNMWRYETWDAINQGDPDGRIAINRELAQFPGKQLVFVRYGLLHRFDEWVNNTADIDSQRIVWARDLGEEDEKLRRYYPDRVAWLLEPDARPPKLVPYAANQE